MRYFIAGEQGENGDECDRKSKLLALSKCISFSFLYYLAGERELPNYYNLRKSKLLTLGTLPNGCPPFDELDTHDLYGRVLSDHIWPFLIS